MPGPGMGQPPGEPRLATPRVSWASLFTANSSVELRPRLLSLSTKAWSPPHGLVIFRAEVLNQGHSAPHGHWQCPGMFRVGVLLASGRSRLGMWLNNLQCPGWPHHKEWPAPGISSARRRSPALVGVTSIQGFYVVCIAQPFWGLVSSSVTCWQHLLCGLLWMCRGRDPNVLCLLVRIQYSTAFAGEGQPWKSPGPMTTQCLPGWGLRAYERQLSQNALHWDNPKSLPLCPLSVRSISKSEGGYIKRPGGLHEILLFPKHRDRGCSLPSQSNSGWQ